MKQRLHQLAIMLILCIYSTTNAQTLEFTYDNSGNQEKRELVISIISMSTTNYEETEQEEDTMLPKSNSLNGNATSIEIFPNPVVDILNVDWNYDLQIVEIMLFDNTGKLVQLKKVYEGTTRETFNLSSYATGIYYIRVFDTSQQSKSYKIIKK